MNERILPDVVEAEQAVLGSVLIDPDAIAKIDLAPFDFYILKNRWVFSACLDLHGAGRAVDVLTVQNSLTERGQLNEAGGLAYLLELMGAVPTAFHATEYARIVKESAARRRLQVIAQELLQAAVLDDLTKVRRDFSERLLSDDSTPLDPRSERVLRLADLLKQQDQPLDWLLADLIPADGLAILAGPPASGKTFLGLDLALGVASGGTTWGRRAQSSPVLYVDSENSPRLLAQRLRGLLAGRGIAPPSQLFFIAAQPLALTNAADAAWLEAEIVLSGARLVVFDSLVRFLGAADENDSAAVAGMMNTLRRVATTNSCAVLLIHHLRKVSGINIGTALDAVRGSGDLTAAVDTVLLVRGAEGAGTVTVGKSRWVETPEPFGFGIAADGPALVITTGAASESARRKVDQVTQAIIEIMANSATALARKELIALVDGRGLDASDRTVDSSLALLRQTGRLTVKKSGRVNLYEVCKSAMSANALFAKVRP